MQDKIIATASILGLVVFLMIVTTFVRELDLMIVVLACLAIAIHDFVTSLRGKNGGNGGGAKGAK